MNPLTSIADFHGLSGRVCLAIGVFDGVHLGHRAVICNAMEEARRCGASAAVLTFHPHPLKVLAPDRAPRLLTATAHKVSIIQSLGVDRVGVARFNRAFSRIEPRTFVEQLQEILPGLLSISVGTDWSFGKDRSGNVGTLQQLGDRLGFRVLPAAPVTLEGAPISSTRIRESVERGELDLAERLLGRRYGVMGTVLRGEQLGTRLGFPTANLSAHSEQFPPDGVYAVEVRHHARTYQGVANIGWRPTVPQAAPERLLEVHVFDLDADLYGQDIEAVFLKLLRSEKRFDSLEELKRQIARDAAQARELFEQRIHG